MNITEERRQENQLFRTRCVLNFEKMDLDIPIYRVFPQQRLLELFNNKKNTLVKPSMWDDPFENVLFQQKAITLDNHVLYFDKVREKFYGQCWTLNDRETDALWRIYSPNKDGIRVKTTLKKLWENFYNINDVEAMTSYFVGKILYQEESEMKTFFENPSNIDLIFKNTDNEFPVQTLLLKRKEFEHENEVRLIYSISPENHQLYDSIYQYDIDPIDLIDEILFDPRFDDHKYNIIKTLLRNFGYSKIIDKSKLYQLPNFNIKVSFSIIGQ